MSCSSNQNQYHVNIEKGFMKIWMSTPSKDKHDHDDVTTAPAPPTANNADTTKSDASVIPETVLQFERQMRKTQAAKRASAPLFKAQLQIVYKS
jgi:hypothetical protein